MVLYARNVARLCVLCAAAGERRRDCESFREYCVRYYIVWGFFTKLLCGSLVWTLGECLIALCGEVYGDRNFVLEPDALGNCNLWRGGHFAFFSKIYYSNMGKMTFERIKLAKVFSSVFIIFSVNVQAKEYHFHAIAGQCDSVLVKIIYLSVWHTLSNANISFLYRFTHFESIPFHCTRCVCVTDWIVLVCHVM